MRDTLLDTHPKINSSLKLKSFIPKISNLIVLNVCTRVAEARHALPDRVSKTPRLLVLFRQQSKRLIQKFIFSYGICYQHFYFCIDLVFWFNKHSNMTFNFYGFFFIDGKKEHSKKCPFLWPLWPLNHVMLWLVKSNMGKVQSAEFTYLYMLITIFVINTWIYWTLCQWRNSV